MELVGYPFQVITADVDESRVNHPDPVANVVETARLKAAVILAQQTGTRDRPVIIAADTTVALDGSMLGKPANPDEAQAMLLALRGRTHHVHTGLVIVSSATGQELAGVSTAVVTMRPYTDEEIEAYVASGDPLDKAGAYAIQHPTFRPVANLEGCYTGVMGLSVCHLLQYLNQLGIPIRASLTAVQASHQGFPCPIFQTLLTQY